MAGLLGTASPGVLSQGWARRGSAWPGAVRFGPARFGWAGFAVAGRGLAWRAEENEIAVAGLGGPWCGRARCAGPWQDQVWGGVVAS
jgi:hypothetical protein